MEMPPNVLKAALKTMNKLLAYKSVRDSLCAGSHSNESLLLSLYELQFDSHDQDQEEVMMLTIQKLVLQIVKNFDLQ